MTSTTFFWLVKISSVYNNHQKCVQLIRPPSPFCNPLHNGNIYYTRQFAKSNTVTYNLGYEMFQLFCAETDTIETHTLWNYEHIKLRYPQHFSMSMCRPACRRPWLKWEVHLQCRDLYWPAAAGDADRCRSGRVVSEAVAELKQDKSSDLHILQFNPFIAVLLPELMDKKWIRNQFE